MIAFRLNGRSLELEVDPAERLLDLLRYRLDLTGTKEGCGEGECGACTVVIDGLPVDSCLVLAEQVDGREVVTIEALDTQRLDPFLRTGATQCGACTPGVVMTGTWIRDHPEILETHGIRELMAGNLCRCTGYDGIIEGVEAALAEDRAAPGETGAAPSETRAAGAATVETGAAPAEIGEPKPIARAAIRGSGSVLKPDSVDEALVMLAEHPEAVPVAGATDLLVHWPGRLEEHDRTYVDVWRLDELRPHRWTDDELEIGGLTTYWDLVRDPRIAEEFPLLVDAGRQVGAVQIQARGTWAGNIVNASPAADGVPVLMAYDALVDLISSAGEETIPLSDFYRGYKEMRLSPGQLIGAIRLPRRRHDIQWFDKVGSRAAQAITKVGVAVTRRARDPARLADPGIGRPEDGRWRVVANSVAPVVLRCRAVEALLERAAPIGSVGPIETALAADVSPIDDIRSTAEYRSRVLARLLYFGLRDRVEFVT